MLRLRARTVELCRRVVGLRPQNVNDNSALFGDAIVLVQALEKRVEAGEATTLRQLHKLTPLSQSRAMRALSDLEEQGLVEIDHVIHDAWESCISLTQRYHGQV